MKTYKVYTDQNVFEMEAPLYVIAEMYGLREEAIKRIEREAKDGCILHFNGRHRRLVGVVIVEGGVR